MKKFFSFVALFLSALLFCAVGVNATASTGTITFGTNKTVIDSASVTCKDSLDNTWTITTSGTSSFTANTDYYQIGSSKNPAKSISFTTTFTEDLVSNVSVKLGGFSNTAGNVDISVDKTSIGSGKLNASTNVTVSNSSTLTGSRITISISSIAKGVKVYSISYTLGTTTTPSAEPSISISNANTDKYAYVEEDLTLTKTASNFESTDVITWTSSDTSVATVSNGVVTPLKTGETKIKAACTAKNVESNELTLTVLPKKGSTLTVAEAKALCKYAASGEYKTTGTVSNAGKSTFNLTDSTGTILVHMTDSNMIDGNTVTVTGILKVYSGTDEYDASDIKVNTSINTQPTLDDELDELNAYAKLAYRYETVNKTYDLVPTLTTVGFGFMNPKSDLSYDMGVSYENVIFDVTTLSNTMVIMDNGRMTLNKGDGISIKLDKDAKFDILDDGLSMIGTNISDLSVLQDGNEILIENETEKEVYITKFTITTTEIVSMTSKAVLMVAVDKDINELATSDIHVGIKIIQGSKDLVIYANECVIDETDGVMYAIINLGDVLNNLDRVTDEFTICAYSYEYSKDAHHNSVNQKEVSVKSLLKEYYSIAGTKPLVEDFYNLLVKLGVKFGE